MKTFSHSAAVDMRIYLLLDDGCNNLTQLEQGKFHTGERLLFGLGYPAATTVELPRKIARELMRRPDFPELADDSKPRVRTAPKLSPVDSQQLTQIEAKNFM